MIPKYIRILSLILVIGFTSTFAFTGYIPAIALTFAVADTFPENDGPFDKTFDLDRPLIGTDISFVPKTEARGTTYSDKGVEKDVVEILKDYRFNWIRLRLIVDPTSEGGYSKDGFCGLEKTLEMAKRVKEAGMKFLLDFHLSL